MALWGRTTCQRSLAYLFGTSNAFGSTQQTPYIALSSTAITDSLLTGLLEPATGSNWNNYARQPFTGGTSAASAQCANTNTVTFPTATTIGGFTALWYVIYLSTTAGSDAPTATTFLCAGLLTQSLQANIGVPVVGSVGSFTISLSDVVDATHGGLTNFGANTILDVLQGKTVNPSTLYNTTQYYSLYTANPTNSQTANTNETAYTNYVRISSASFAFSAATAATPSVVTASVQANFAVCGASGATILGWGVGPTSSGASNLYFAGPTTSQVIGVGDQPYIASGATMASLS